MRTITADKEIDRLFAGGRRVSHPALLVLVVRTPEAQPQDGRVLFVAGKSLGGAVIRNRCKRVLRELVRRVGGPWPGWDVALVARRATATAATGMLDGALERAMKTLRIAE